MSRVHRAIDRVDWYQPDALAHLPRNEEPTAVAIGVFDGVHRGHRMLIRRVTDATKQLDGGIAGVVTFDPNPSRVLHPDRYLGDLTTVGLRLRLLERIGVRRAWVVHFSQAFAQRSGESFVESLLAHMPHLTRIVVGADFHLGRGRDVHAGTLATIAERRGVRVDIVQPLTDNGGSISSSRVRRAVAAGNVEQAAHLLGRPYTLDINGSLPESRGECAQLLPLHGTYRCVLLREGRSREGMMEVSRTGYLHWEPRDIDVRYVVLRRSLHGTELGTET